MPSTFTDNLVLEKQATGENSGTWGTLLNTVIGQIDDAVTGELQLSVAGSTDVTLTAAQALNAWYEFTGALTGNINVIVPTVEKLAFVFNNTTGAFTLTVKTSAGTGVAITQGDKDIVYADGTNVVLAHDFLRLGGGTVDGATTFSAALTISGTSTVSGPMRFSAAPLNLAYGTIAIAGTMNLGTGGNTFYGTGSATVEAFGTASIGAIRHLIFGTGALVVHDGTKILPSSYGTVTAQSNDVLDLVSDGAGNWRDDGYHIAAAPPRLRPRLDAAQIWTGGQRGYYGTIADASGGTLAVNFGTANNFVCTLTNTGTTTRVLGNHTLGTSGQSGVFEFVQPAGGNAQLQFASNYRFAGTSTIALTTGVGSTRDVIGYGVLNDGTSVLLSALKAVG